MPARQIGPIKKQVRNTRKPAGQRTSRISWIWTSAQSRLISAMSLESLGRGRRGSDLDWDSWSRPASPSCCRSGYCCCGLKLRLWHNNATPAAQRLLRRISDRTASPADTLPRRLCAPASGPRSVRWLRFFEPGTPQLNWRCSCNPPLVCQQPSASSPAPWLNCLGPHRPQPFRTRKG